MHRSKAIALHMIDPGSNSRFPYVLPGMIPEHRYRTKPSELPRVSQNKEKRFYFINKSIITISNLN